MYVYADDIKKLAEDIINKENMSWINLEEVVFVRLEKDLKHGDRVTLGRCVALGDRTQFISGKKYLIEFPKAYDLIESDDDKRMVVHHELCHIPQDGKWLIDHDIQEFEIIFKKYPAKMFDLIKRVSEKQKLQKDLEKLKKKQEELG